MGWNDVPWYVKNSWKDRQELINSLYDQSRERWRAYEDRESARREAERQKQQLANEKANYGIYPRKKNWWE